MASSNARITQVLGHFGHLVQKKRLLEDQVAIITGGAQGIGAETARLFASQGARVVLADLDKDKAETVVKEIQNVGGRAIAVIGNMMESGFIANLIQEAAAFGGGKIHIIVNNAGYTWDGMIHRMSDKQWDNIISLHATSSFKLVREAAPYFRLQDGDSRCIVNISSTSGIHGNIGQANYALAKAGVVGLTKTIAKEWGHFGVRANTVAFGYISTRLTAAKEGGAFVTTADGEKIILGIPQNLIDEKAKAANADIPLGRPGTAMEAAASVLAVASPLFGYVTGQTIMVTGGRNM